MPGLYGFTGNANVAVSDTPGLYIGSGAVQILNSAAQLLTILDNNGNVNFALDPATAYQTVYAYTTSSPTLYGNTNVAQYLPHYGGVVDSYQIQNNNYVNVASENAVQLQYDPSGTYDFYNLENGNWVYLDPNGLTYQSNVTGVTKGVSFDNLGSINTDGNVNVGNNLYTTNGIYWSGNGQPYSTGGSSSYGNANVAAYLASNSDPTISNLNANAITQQTQININTNAIAILNANLGAFETYANATFSTGGGSNYGNSNVAAYLPTYSGQLGGTIVIPNFSTANAEITGGNVSVYNSTATNRFIGTYFDASGSGGGSLRNAGQTALIQWGGGGGTNITINGAININPANAQVDISPTGTGSVNIHPNNHLDISPVGYGTMNNVIIGNVTPQLGIFTTLQTSGNITANAGAYFIGDGSKLTGITTTSTYGDANVATFLSSGFGSNTITTTGAITAGNLITTNGVFWSNGTVYSTGGGTGTYGDSNVISLLSSFGSNTITTTGAITAGNLITTNGVFWSNGVAYGTGAVGPAGPAFSGNLAGNVLYDSVNQRVFVNAFPLSKPVINSATYKGSNSNNWLITAPVYTAGVVAMPGTQGANQNQNSIALGSFASANVTYTSSGQTAQNRRLGGHVQYTGYWPQTGNSFAVQDRVFSHIPNLDLFLTGQTYGVMTANATTAGAITVAGSAPFVTVNGYGNVASVVGVSGGVQVVPQIGQTANVLYATASFSTISLNSVNQGIGNIAYARLLSGSVAGFSSNLTVQTAIGLHTWSGWAGTIGTTSAGAQTAYAVLNEDASTRIQTNGNVSITGNTSLGPYREIPYVGGNASGTLTINKYNGPIQTYTLTGDITINTNNLIGWDAGTCVTLVLTQDATGNRALTSNILFAASSKTLSTSANAIDVINIFTPNGTTFLASLVKGYA